MLVHLFHYFFTKFFHSNFFTMLCRDDNCVYSKWNNSTMVKVVLNGDLLKQRELTWLSETTLK